MYMFIYIFMNAYIYICYLLLDFMYTYIYVHTCIYERNCKLLVRKILKSGGHITVVFMPSCTHA